MMYSTRFIDETYDIDNCINYTLSIQLTLDGFSFSILDQSVNKFILLSEQIINTVSPFELKNKIVEIVKNEPILQKEYKKVNICYITQKVTLVPTSLIDKENKEAFFDILFSRERDEEIIDQSIDKNTCILSAFPRILKEQLESLFPNCNFLSPAKAEFSFVKNQVTHHQTFLVSKYSHTLFLTVIINNKIEFFNSFFVKNDTDCLYYILNTVNQFKSSLKKQLIYIGQIEPRSELPSQLKNYFETVTPARFSKNYKVSYTFFKEPENYHLPLIELALCE